MITQFILFIIAIEVKLGLLSFIFFDKIRFLTRSLDHPSLTLEGEMRSPKKRTFLVSKVFNSFNHFLDLVGLRKSTKLGFGAELQEVAKKAEKGAASGEDGQAGVDSGCSESGNGNFGGRGDSAGRRRTNPFKDTKKGGSGSLKRRRKKRHQELQLNKGFPLGNQFCWQKPSHPVYCHNWRGETQSQGSGQQFPYSSQFSSNNNISYSPRGSGPMQGFFPGQFGSNPLSAMYRMQRLQQPLGSYQGPPMMPMPIMSPPFAQERPGVWNQGLQPSPQWAGQGSLNVNGLGIDGFGKDLVLDFELEPKKFKSKRGRRLARKAKPLLLEMKRSSLYQKRLPDASFGASDSFCGLIEPSLRTRLPANQSPQWSPQPPLPHFEMGYSGYPNAHEHAVFYRIEQKLAKLAQAVHKQTQGRAGHLCPIYEHSAEEGLVE